MKDFSIRTQMAKVQPGTAKLDTEIVREMRRWFLDGVTTKEAHERVTARGYRVKLDTVRDIKGGRAWAIVQP